MAALDAGRGGLLLIGGEAGIGKTALIMDGAREAAARGALVLTGACDDLAQTSPYGPWFAIIQACHDQCPELPPLSGRLAAGAAGFAAFDGQEALADGIRQLLREVAARRPVLVVLEDIHWADAASLAALHHLARGPDGAGLLVMATYRPEELGQRHPLAALLPRLVREGRVERVDLGELDDGATRELVCHRYPLTADDAARLAAYLQARSGGNPFFINEVLRTLEAERLLTATAGGWQVGDLERAPVPPLVRHVVEGRLERLDEADRQLLELAAVIGEEVPLDLWRLVGGVDVDRVLEVAERAVDAHLLRSPTGTTHVGFTHALVRDALYHGQPLSRRRARHRRVAEVLGDRSDAPAGVVAAHFEQADDVRAIEWLVRAGEQALALYAADDAIAVLTRAQELAARAGDALPLGAYRARASAYVLSGQFDRALGDHEVVLARARASGDRRAEWQALLDLGLHWAEREHERSGQHCRAALDLARAIDDRSLIAHSLNRVANWHLNRDEPAAAIPLHQEALTLFQGADDRVGIAHTLDLLGMTGFLSGDVEMGTRYYDQAIPLLQEIGDRQRRSTCLAMLGSQAGDLDCFVPAPMTREAAFWIRRGEEAVAVAREIGWSAGEAFALAVLCETTAAQGDFGRALQQAEAARAIAERIGHRVWTVQSHFKLGRVWVELLDARRAAAELEHALVLARLSGSRLWIAVVSAVLASLNVSVGHLDRAAILLEEVIRYDEPGRSAVQWLCWLAGAELELARGAPARCLEIVDQVERLGRAQWAEHGNPRLLKLRADALARLRRIDEAERAYLAARASAALLGHRPLGWRTDAALARLYAAEGRSADAEAAGQRARATIADLAATIPDQAARDHFLARAGAPLPTAPTRRRGASVPRLTPRELEVLRCLIEGESDREIGAELGISPRTVMRHVAGILNKLGVTSRTAAATLAIRQELV